jgi:hypothetical protein
MCKSQIDRQQAFRSLHWDDKTLASTRRWRQKIAKKDGVGEQTRFAPAQDVRCASSRRRVLERKACSCDTRLLLTGCLERSVRRQRAACHRSRQRSPWSATVPRPIAAALRCDDAATASARATEPDMPQALEGIEAAKARAADRDCLSGARPQSPPRLPARADSHTALRHSSRTEVSPSCVSSRA